MHAPTCTHLLYKLHFIAVASIDTVRFLKDDQKQWELCLEHSLFTIGKLKILVLVDFFIMCAFIFIHINLQGELPSQLNDAV